MAEHQFSPLTNLFLLSLAVLLIPRGCEPYKPWPHTQTPEKLQATMLNFRRDLDAFGLTHGSDCDANDKNNETKAYYKMLKALESGTEEQMFGAEPLAEHYTTLKKALDKFKKGKNPWKLCPSTKGLSCQSGKCDCRTDFEPDFKPEILDIEWDGGKCVLMNNSVCMTLKAGWEAPCDDNFGCFIPEGKQTFKSTEFTVPVHDDNCTLRNREKWDLDPKFPCRCMPSSKRKLDLLKLLYAIAQGSIPLSHGGSCEVKVGKQFHALREAFRKGEVTVAYGIKFYKPKEQVELKNAVERHMMDFGQQSFLCDSVEKNGLMCKDEGKCGCHYGGVYKADLNTCVVPIGSSCGVKGGDGIPYNCEDGGRCVEKLPGVNQLGVLCNQHAADQTAQLGIYKWYYPSDCRCIRRDENYRLSYSKEQLDMIVRKNNKLLKLKAEEVMDVSNTTNWDVLKTDQECNWELDREYFRVMEFILGGLAHVKTAVELRETLTGAVDDANPGSERWPRPRKVCDLKRGMRCRFPKNGDIGKCGCPKIEWFGERADSEPVGGEGGNCTLKKDSLCYPTLEEWLTCSGGQKCFYDELPLRCNRATRSQIIRRGITLKNARCSCSDKTPENISKYLNYRKGVYKKYDEKKKQEL